MVTGQSFCEGLIRVMINLIKVLKFFINYCNKNTKYITQTIYFTLTINQINC